MPETKQKKAKRHTVQYDRWGYFFIAPFFIVYVIFSLIPLISTFYNTFYENYRVGIYTEGPNFKVPRYFKGQQQQYDPQIAATTQALSEIAVSDDGLTIEVIGQVERVINANAYTIDRTDFNAAIASLDKASMTSAEYVQAVSDLVSKTEWALKKNFRTVFRSDILKYTWNTIIMWILGFVPQILISLILSIWFTNTELRLKGQQFFKTVIYMPNLIMASAFAMLFFTLFSDNGPINSILVNLKLVKENIRFLTYTGWTRTLVAMMNFLMWYGNTTILLMAGIMGIDESLFEAARIDGANPIQTFFKITLPLLLPIFVYVLITSMIGGIQMFDVPQILTNGKGTPDRTSMTLIMYLNNNLASKNYGLAGAISLLTFAVTGVLSALVYKSTMKNYSNMKGKR